MDDARRSAPAVARNTGPIVDVLRGILPDSGTVLEIASGSGEHALHFARAFPHLLWQPTDADPVGLRSIDAWRSADALPNLLAPVPLDAAAPVWPVAGADAILCINMVHISPWAATVGLMAGAGRLLASGCLLYLYGAYRQLGVETAPSNDAFDASLKARNPAWGVRDLEDVAAEADRNGLALDTVVAMPANNLSLIFRRG
ncbi:MAG: class I SAM-dependent methyltransferase [Pseudomonadota bacterium]|nr:class I SAM-dependent methyltransferase [Pseudomonadota bacterium]